MQVSSLSEICLSVIVHNFGRYGASFKDPNCNVPWRHQEFLKKFFSETIFGRLKREKKLKTEHLDVLINSHLRELDIQGFERSLLPDLVHNLQIHGKSVLSLKVSSGTLEENTYELLISSLPNLESICFDDHPCVGIYEAIGRNCPLLKSIEMDLDYDVFSEDERDGISFILQHCPCLETLQYPDTIGVLYAIHKSDLLLIKEEQSSTLKQSRKYLLTHLSSSRRDYPLDDALEACATMSPQVTHLFIDELYSNEELERVSSFSLLENIKIKEIYDEITKSCFNQFLMLMGNKLTSLEMPYALCLSVVTLIESCPKLQLLKFRGDRRRTVSERHSALSCKASLPHLRSLEFSFFYFKDQAAADNLRLLLAAAKGVKKLSLYGCTGLTNELVRRLELYHIHELDVGCSDILGDSLRELLLHGNLKKLNIEDCKNIIISDYFKLTKCLSYEQRNIVHINWAKRRSFMKECFVTYRQFVCQRDLTNVA